MAKKRGNWTANLHPRDYRGRFQSKGGGGSKGRRPSSRKARYKRGAATFGQQFAGAAIGGAILPGVGAPIGVYVVTNRRRNAQLKSGQKGLRSTLTGRRLN